MNQTRLTRRTVLKLGAGASLAVPWLFVPRLVSASRRVDYDVVKTRRPFARALAASIVREEPSVKASPVRSIKWNEVVAVSGQTLSDESPSRHNKIWYQVNDGFVHSAFMQPVEDTPQKPESSVPQEGFWGETYVASTAIRAAADPKAGMIFRMPFGTIFQVLDVIEGGDQEAWYRISDGRSEKLYVPGAALRRIKPEEFAPLSPQIPLNHKRIDVDIRKQMVFAYEDDTEVFRARCATGAYFRQADGTVQDFTTTPGEHRIYQKTPSRRMSGGQEGEGDHYDLAGVPWVSYFTKSRIAFHGAYWHNDFGVQRSHGCVNLLPEDSQWVYRWTAPVAPHNERWTDTAKRDEGSLVRVI